MGTRILQFAIITTLFHDWWRALNEKKGIFDCIEKEGDSKDPNRYPLNAALNVDLLQNIFLQTDMQNQIDRRWNLFIAGHGLENDLRHLKLIHDRVIDTSLVFPHFYGLPYRYKFPPHHTNFLPLTSFNLIHQTKSESQKYITSYLKSLTLSGIVFAVYLAYLFFNFSQNY